jgi:osmotically-inducible protein OsmY
MAVPTMRLAAVLRRRQRRPQPAWSGRALLLGLAVGAAAAFLFDPASGRRRRAMAFDRAGATFRRRMREAARTTELAASRATGMTQKVRSVASAPPDDDATIGEKVMTELFSDPLVKSNVNVNVEHGVVYLRGELPTEDKIQEVIGRARKVSGVSEVHSLLHIPSTPAPMRS